MVNWNKPHAKFHIIFPTEPGEYWAELTSVGAPDVRPYYYISNKGRVFNKYSGRLLNMALDSKGYWYYNLVSFHGQRCYRVHRMIMLTFHYIDGCESLEIDHIDTNRANFSEDNLRWCTHAENGKYSYENGHSNPKGEDRPCATITNEKAREICEAIQRGDMMKDIAKRLNVNVNTVYNIASYRAWNHISKYYDFPNKNLRNKFQPKEK